VKCEPPVVIPSAAVLDKAALKTELIAKLTEALEVARAAQASAMDGATNPEARPENSKDTRGLEQSYLARGQAQRVAELEAGIAAVTALALRVFTARDAIAMSALVTVDEDASEQRFFLAPHGGGTQLASGVQVVTPSSPLGRSLLGKRVDDEVDIRLPDRSRSFVIVGLD
jgi:transcription elongation GreA/GreB family factor